LALVSVFFFAATASPWMYALSLHDALPILLASAPPAPWRCLSMTHGGVALGRHRRRTSTGPRFCGPAVRGRGKTGLRCFTLFLRSEEHTSELQSRFDLVCRLLLEKKNR